MIHICKYGTPSILVAFVQNVDKVYIGNSVAQILYTGTHFQ